MSALNINFEYTIERGYIEAGLVLTGTYNQCFRSEQYVCPCQYEFYYKKGIGGVKITVA